MKSQFTRGPAGKWLRGLVAAAILLTAAAIGLAQTSSKPAAPKKPAALNEAARGDVKKGKEIFNDWCEICHFAESGEKKIGPGLKGIYKRGKFADGKKVDDKAMRIWIEKGGTDMPSFKDSLTAEQISDLIAFLRTL